MKENLAPETIDHIVEQAHADASFESGWRPALGVDGGIIGFRKVIAGEVDTDFPLILHEQMANLKVEGEET